MRSYVKALMTDQRNTPLDAIPKFVLWLLSLIYGQVTRLRNRGYDQQESKSTDVGVPVVSVGNITMGGAGKTPLVVFIAQQVVASGKKPVVLLRGYMPGDRSSVESDEALMIQRKVPEAKVIVGADRVATAQSYLKEGQCDVFILDDAFQHRKIKRQLDIVAIDTLQLFGNECVIPRGILREPLTGLQRADLFVLTRSDLSARKTAAAVDRCDTLFPKQPLITSVHQAQNLVELGSKEKQDLSSVSGKTVIAFSGLGNPAGFQGTLKQLGVEVAEHIAYEDHYAYQAVDLHVIKEKAALHKTQTVLTTMKDAVKIEPYLKEVPELHILYVDVEIEIVDGQEEFFNRIRSVLRP